MSLAKKISDNLTEETAHELGGVFRQSYLDAKKLIEGNKIVEIVNRTKISIYQSYIISLIAEIISYTSFSKHNPLNYFKFIFCRKKSIERIKELTDKINLHLEEIEKLKHD